MNIKEKLMDALGGLGLTIYYIMSVVGFIFPVVMIMVSFDLPFWMSFVLTAILFILPSFSFIFWIIGLVGAITGPQDVVATIYYVAFALACLPRIIYMIIGFFVKD